MDQYSLDLKSFDLREYKKILVQKDILPGRIILKEKIEERFDILEKEHIKNLQDLHNALKTKKKIEDFAIKTNLSIEYLTVLRRDVNAYTSKPVHLDEFHCVSKPFIEKLQEHGILHSKHYFDLTISKEDRNNMVQLTGIDLEEVLKLTKLTNLVRINGVGPTFAIMLFDAGFDTIEKILETKDEEIQNRVAKLNKNNAYTKARFILEDVEYVKKFASKLPLCTKY